MSNLSSFYHRRRLGRAPSPPTWLWYEQIPFDHLQDSDSDMSGDSISADEDDDDDEQHQQHTTDPTDFTAYIDVAPVALEICSPMDLVYECFVKLGLRYICVLREGRFVGLVHKKAFVKYCREVEEGEKH